MSKITEPEKPTKPKLYKSKTFEFTVVETLKSSISKDDLIALFRKYEHDDFHLKIESYYYSNKLAIYKKTPIQLTAKQQVAENKKRSKYELELKQYQQKLEKYREEMIKWLDQETKFP